MVRRDRQQPRDTYKYELRHKRRIVYVGTSNGPDDRLTEHVNAGKRFTSMSIVGRRTTREAAERWEKSRLASYRHNHGGRNPKYNKRRDG